MIKGWLIVNEFLGGEKFKSTSDLFYESAKKFDIELTTVTNADLMVIPETLPDFAILWDKDYALAKRLENRGLRLFNSADSMALCDDKSLTFTNLEHSGIKMPKTLVTPKTFLNIGYTNLDFVERAVEELRLPMIIKENCGSFGQQVYLAKSADEAKSILKDIGGKGAVMQEFIKESSGVDLRVNVVGDKVVSAIKRTGEGFISNITFGGKAENYEVTKEQRDLAINVCKMLGLDFGGVDLLFSKDGPILCEVNSNLQFKSSLDATGINVADYILEYIGKAL